MSGINGVAERNANVLFLAGDVTMNGMVDQLDVGGVKARAGWTVDQSNFIYDLNLSGRITGADIIATRVRIGTSAP